MESKDGKQPLNRYIIQIERPGKKIGMDEARSLLEPLGVEVDPSYGPIPVNPKLGHYVVRGMATEEARERAQQLEGVKFFGDVKIAPTRFEASQKRRSL